MLQIYVIAKPFGPYQKGDTVQFSPEDALRFKAYLAGSDNKPAEKPAAKLEEDKKAPKASKK